MDNGGICHVVQSMVPWSKSSVRGNAMNNRVHPKLGAFYAIIDNVKRGTRASRNILKDHADWKGVEIPNFTRKKRRGLVEFVVAKWKNIKSKSWGKKKEQQDSYIQLKNSKLDLQDATRHENNGV
ncbi:hypothetical protein Tco_1348458 [Tanacetum coccineum]